MLVEISKDLKTGYLYTNKEINIDNIICTEKINSLYIYKFKNQNFNVKNNSFKIESLFSEYEHANKLPEDGWQELIDYWSCHNSEFRSVLDLKMRPRKNGVLYSYFYFIKDRKIFYNELFDEEICDKIIFNFFENHFVNNNSFVFFCGCNIEVKFFNVVYLEENDGLKKAFKVGYKETKKIPKYSDAINEYFSKMILNRLVENKLDIEILGYKLSFIRW